MKNVQFRNGMQRVFGGEIAANPIQWQVLLYRSMDGNYLCGGSLIDQTTILTAAHCFNTTVGTRSTMAITPSLYKIAVASKVKDAPFDEWLEPERIIVHPQYDYNNAQEGNDIAIIKLPWNRRITYGLDIAPICLPTRNFQDRTEDCDFNNQNDPMCSFFMRRKCFVSGFGKIEESNNF